MELKSDRPAERKVVVYRHHPLDIGVIVVLLGLLLLAGAPEIAGLLTGGGVDAASIATAVAAGLAIAFLFLAVTVVGTLNEHRLDAEIETALRHADANLQLLDELKRLRANERETGSRPPSTPPTPLL